MMERPILGESKPVKKMIEMINRVARSNTNVLIRGESGTGKELVARMIHSESEASQKPFVAVNCGAIPENLIESELFGHMKGSFTGAVSDKKGLFEVAHTGTIFLDEVGELPLAMQVKLLRAIQEKTFRRVGGNQNINVELRIISATNRDLEEGIASQTFREDLFYRLNVITIQTPPLRERGKDIELLAKEFLDRFVERSGKKISKISEEAMKALTHYSWPGNVRELENALERSVTLESGEELTLESLPKIILDSMGQTGEEAPFPKAPRLDLGAVDLEGILETVEKRYIEAALKEANGVKTAAAELLGLSFRSFRYRLQKLGLEESETDK